MMEFVTGVSNCRQNLTTEDAGVAPAVFCKPFSSRKGVRLSLPIGVLNALILEDLRKFFPDLSELLSGVFKSSRVICLSTVGVSDLEAFGGLGPGSILTDFE